MKVAGSYIQAAQPCCCSSCWRPPPALAAPAVCAQSEDLSDDIRLWLYRHSGNILHATAAHFATIELEVHEVEVLFKILDDGEGWVRVDDLEAAVQRPRRNATAGQLLRGVGYYSAYLLSDKVRVIIKHNADKQYFTKSEKMFPSLCRRMQNKSMVWPSAAPRSLLLRH